MALSTYSLSEKEELVWLRRSQFRYWDYRALHGHTGELPQKICMSLWLSNQRVGLGLAYNL